MPDISEKEWVEYDDRNTEQQPNGWPGGMPAYIDQSGRMMMGAIKRSWRRSNPYYETTGVGDDYVVEPDVSFPRINEFEILRLRIDRGNTTTSPTLKFGEWPAAQIRKASASGIIDVGIGDLIPGADQSFWYDGTHFILSNPGTLDPGIDAGLLHAAANLSDLNDVAEARDNLGLGSAATADASSFQPNNVNLTVLAGVTPGTAGLSLLAKDTVDDAMALLQDGAVKPTGASVGVGLAARFGSYVDAREENVQAGVAADQSAGLIAAINRATSEGKELVLPPGDIRCDQQLPILSGLRLIGRDQRATLDFSNAGAITSLFSGSGSLAAAVTVTVDADPGDDQITATDHGLAVGDWFRIISTIDCNSSAAGDLRLGDRANVVPFVETLEVAEVVSANVVRIRGGLRFVYPTGSTIRKITSISDVRIRELKMNAGNLSLAPFTVELGQNVAVEDVTVLNPATWVTMRGCFGRSRMIRFTALGDPDNAEATNFQFIKPVDGTTGFLIEDAYLANGGQMIDVTYTTGNALVAPTLDTTIKGGLFRDSSFSAVTDHPGCMGTSVLGATFQGCISSVLIRSRNAIVQGNRGFGTKSVAANSIGIWLGENGYWNGATIANNLMVNFDVGFAYAGAVSTIGRDTLDSGNEARGCRVGMQLGNSTSTITDFGFKSRDFRCDRVAETGITINGAGDGVDIEGLQIRGPLTNAGVEVTGDLLHAKIKGEVIDIGASVPALKVASGAPVGMDIDIRRRGTCGLNSGVTRAMVAVQERVLFSSTTTFTLTGSTVETTAFDNFFTIPNGAFDETARIKLRIKGATAGTAGTKTLRLRAGASLWSGSLALNATAAGPFDAEMEIVGSGAAAQQAYSKYLMTGVAAAGLDGPTNRTINLAAGAVLDLTVQLAAAADTITINSFELLGSWA